VGHRVGLDAVEKSKILLLPGIKPRPSIPLSVDIPALNFVFNIKLGRSAEITYKINKLQFLASYCACCWLPAWLTVRRQHVS
jgi:hypothetical protein